MKKYISCLYSLIFLSFLSCSTDELFLDNQQVEFDENLEIEICNGRIIKPEWLVNLVDSINGRNAASYFLNSANPSVIGVEYGGTKYVNVINPLSDDDDTHSVYYDFNGKIVNPNSELHSLLSTEDNRRLVWNSSISNMDNEKLETRSYIGPAIIFTPKGSRVPSCSYRSNDYNADDIEFWKQEVRINHPEAIILSDPTTAYNCHSYAWYSQSCSNNVWFAASSPSVYLEDHSYQEIPNAIEGAKVKYENGDHSAVVTDNPNVYISKWTDGCLVKHTKYDCPYEEPGIIHKYYVRDYRPNFYISSNSEAYTSTDPTILASNNYANFTMHAFSPYCSPTRYVWTVQGGDGTDRWYSYPNGSRVDVSIYFPAYPTRCTIRLYCEMYSGSQLLGTAQTVVTVISQGNTMSSFEEIGEIEGIEEFEE